MNSSYNVLLLSRYVTITTVSAYSCMFNVVLVYFLLTALSTQASTKAP